MVSLAAAAAATAAVAVACISIVVFRRPVMMTVISTIFLLHDLMLKLIFVEFLPLSAPSGSGRSLPVMSVRVVAVGSVMMSVVRAGRGRSGPLVFDEFLEGGVGALAPALVMMVGSVRIGVLQDAFGLGLFLFSDDGIRRTRGCLLGQLDAVARAQTCRLFL